MAGEENVIESGNGGKREREKVVKTAGGEEIEKRENSRGRSEKLER